MSTIKITHLTKIYGNGENKIIAVNDLSMDINEGCFLAVTGRSGSGKTTLLHMIGGLDSPTNGEVFIENKAISRLTDNERTILRRRRMGFIFQFFNLMPELTAYQNIVLPLKLDGRNIDHNYVSDIVVRLGIENRLSHYPDQLSGGQQQRVAIARALSTKPAVILADEPTGNLDGKSSEEVLNLLKFLKKEYNQTLILATHDMKIAEGSDRIVTLEDGKIIRDTEECK